MFVIAYVLLPYKFTLLSNKKENTQKKSKVLLPYKFTLLSNNIEAAG